MKSIEEYNFQPEEIIEYLRKSRADDPRQTVEDLISKHRDILNSWQDEHLSGRIPEYNIYKEKASAETIKDRPEFQRVLSRIESPSIRAVLVVDVPRLSRGDLEDAGKVLNSFRYSKTYIITKERVYDPTDEVDLMFLEMQLKQGNQYLEYTKKVLSRGKEVAASKGAFLTCNPPFGYDKAIINGIKSLVPNENAEWVKKIFELRLEGRSNDYISKYLTDMNVPCPSGAKFFTPTGIDYILKNITYTGKIKYRTYTTEKILQNGIVIKKQVRNPNYTVYDGVHEAIISEELFNSVNNLPSSPAAPRLNKSKEMVNPFSGLIMCKNCGHVMYLRHYRGYKIITCKHQNKCHNGSVQMKYIVDHLISLMNAHINNFEFLMKNDTGKEFDDYNLRVESLKKQLAALEEKELKYWKDRYEPTSVQMPEQIFQRLISECQKAKSDVTANLQRLLDNPIEKIDYQEKIERFSNAVTALENPDLSPLEQNNLLKTCVENIIFYRPIEKVGRISDRMQRVPCEIEVNFKI